MFCCLYIDKHSVFFLVKKMRIICARLLVPLGALSSTKVVVLPFYRNRDPRHRRRGAQGQVVR
jgi:hypothetical protein